jgi:membrane protein
MLSLGILLTLWSGSGIFGSLRQGLNAMYDLREDRSWWRLRAMDVGMLFLGLALVAAGATAILAGEEIAAALGADRLLAALRYPLAFLVLATFLWAVYYVLPAREQKVAARWITLGALSGAALWLVATILFRLYVANVASYGSYGVVGAILVLLLWLYLSGLAILFGGEVAVSLEQGVHRPRRRRGQPPRA